MIRWTHRRETKGPAGGEPDGGIMKKFYKTVLTVIVLSEHEPVNSECELGDIARQIDTGDWVGQVKNDGGTELTGKEAADALKELGSNPGFFQIDEDGRPEADEGDEFEEDSEGDT